MLLAAPAGGQRRGGFEPHPRIARGKFGDKGGGAIRGMIVEHDDFKLRVATGQNRRKRRANVPLLVARGDEDGDSVGADVRRL